MAIKKRCSVLLSLLLIAPTGASALETPVTLTQGANVIDITVPVVMPISVDSKGIVTTANKVDVTNNSKAPVLIDTLNVKTKDGWKLQEFNKDYSGVKLGAKEFGLKLDSENVNTDGTVKSRKRIINGKDKFNLSYDATVAPQKDSIVNSNIADVILTVGWSSSSGTGTESGSDSGTEGETEPPPSSVDEWKHLGSLIDIHGSMPIKCIKEKIYVTGGTNGGFNKNMRVWDADKQDWEGLKKEQTGFYLANADSFVVGDKIYYMGANSGSANTRDLCYVYDTKTDEYTQLANTPDGYPYSTANFYNNGKFYKLGGRTSSTTQLDTILIYDVATDTWETSNIKIDEPFVYASAQMIKGEVYIVGSSTGKAQTNLIKLNMETGETTIVSKLPQALSSVTTAVIGNKLYVIGGQTYKSNGWEGSYSNKVYAYDIKEKNWDIKADFLHSIHGASANVYNGGIYVMGGYKLEGNSSSVSSNSMYKYTP